MPPSRVRFDTFEFDFASQQLRKAGFRVRLSASQVPLLTLFLERAGELITRQQIIDRIWTDTNTIDVTRGINTAINRLRAILGDNPANPVFLETVIGLGYRFIVPVETIPVRGGSPETASQQPVPNTEPEALRVPPPPDEPATTTPIAEELKPLVGLVVRSLRFTRSHSSLPVLGAAIVLFAVLLLLLRHAMPSPKQTVDVPRDNTFLPVTLNRGDGNVTAQAISPSGSRLAHADQYGISLHLFGEKDDYGIQPVPVTQVTHLAWFPDETSLLVIAIDAATKRSNVMWYL